ncbi:MAG: hypothetical protein NTV88_00950 [Candidatus Micrarchaeota archaeon]|nr:hypothetical protein [Candidatus Micrarchaeota archaeon]
MEISNECYLTYDCFAGYRCCSCGVVGSVGEGYVPNGWTAKIISEKGLIGSDEIAELYCPKCAGKKR